jgi:hypothetical protein
VLGCPLPLDLCLRGHAVVENRPYADDLANPYLGFEEHATYEVGTVGFGIGAVLGGWIGVGLVDPE